MQPLLLPPSFQRGLCVLLQCLCSAQAGLHRSLEFAEVTHYLLSLMSEVGQNSFLLLPPQNIDGHDSMEVNGKFLLVCQWLGLCLHAEMRRSDEKGGSEESELGI